MISLVPTTLFPWYIWNMHKPIAITLALVVVLGTFFGKELLPAIGFAAAASETPSFSSPGFSFPTLPVGTWGNAGASAGEEAWETFAAYRSAAGRLDLPEVARLSYQLSPTCATALSGASDRAECNRLMESVAFFTQDLRREDFTEVASDDRQIVLATDYMEAEGVGAVKWVLYFVRDAGTPKLLGINFCTGQDTETDVCVETRPEKRDMNNNGWWDSLEGFLNK